MVIGLGDMLRALTPFKLDLSCFANFKPLHTISPGAQTRIERVSKSPSAATRPLIFQWQGTHVQRSTEDTPLPDSICAVGGDAGSEEGEVDEGDSMDGVNDELEQDTTVENQEEDEPSIDEQNNARSVKDHDIDAETDFLTNDEDIDTAEGDEIEWTPEMVQAVREKTYVTFEGEDQSNYTLGPARMIDAADGVVTCTALLVTMELSQATQASVQGLRDFAKAEATAKARLKVISRLQSPLSTQILRTKRRMGAIADDESAEAAEQKQPLEEEFSVLNMMVEEFKVERSSIKNNMEFQGEQLRRVQAEANTLLKEAWTAAKIIEPEPEDVENDATQPIDLQAEYHAFREKLKNDGDFSMLQPADAPLDTINDLLRKDISPEDKAREEELERLQQATWDAWHRLQDAQAAFDHRDEDRYHEERAREATIARGDRPEDAFSEMFDLRWHVHERALTRELIEAEEALGTANTAAIEAGAIHDDNADFDNADEYYDGSDVLIDDVSDGYRLSFEEEIIASCPVATIEKWLAGLPDLDHGNEADTLDVSDQPADEWEAEELGFGDSITEIIVNEMNAPRNPMRKKTGEWREVQRQLAADFAAM